MVYKKKKMLKLIDKKYVFKVLHIICLYNLYLLFEKKDNWNVVFPSKKRHLFNVDKQHLYSCFWIRHYPYKSQLFCVMIY